MAQQVKMLALKTDDLSSIPKTHMEERKSQFLQVVLRPPHTSCDTHTHIHTQINKCKKLKQTCQCLCSVCVCMCVCVYNAYTHTEFHYVIPAVLELYED